MHIHAYSIIIYHWIIFHSIIYHWVIFHSNLHHHHHHHLHLSYYNHSSSINIFRNLTFLQDQILQRIFRWESIPASDRSAKQWQLWTYPTLDHFIQGESCVNHVNLESTKSPKKKGIYDVFMFDWCLLLFVRVFFVDGSDLLWGLHIWLCWLQRASLKIQELIAFGKNLNEVWSLWQSDSPVESSAFTKFEVTDLSSTHLGPWHTGIRVNPIAAIKDGTP